MPSYTECWYPARAINVNPLRGTICVSAQATGERECDVLNIGCFAELNTSNNFDPFFRIFSSFNYSSYVEPAEICFSCFSNMPNERPSTIGQCIYSLSNLELLSMAVYNLNIYTRIQIGPIIINMLDFNNCYESNTVTVTYDYLTSILTINGDPTYTCTALTRAQLSRITLDMVLNSTMDFMFSGFDIAQFSFNTPTIESGCAFSCREEVFAVTERAGIDGLLTLDFENSIYGGDMTFSVQKIFSSRGYHCFANLLTTIAPYYIGTSIQLLQADECSGIRIPADQLVQIQVIIFDEDYSPTAPVFQQTSHLQFKLLTRLNFVYTACYEASSSGGMCAELTELISSNHNIKSEIVLSFPNYTMGKWTERLVLRYPVPTTALGVWGFINAYIGKDHIFFITQKLIQAPMDDLLNKSLARNETTILVNVYLQSKSLNNLTRIMSIRVPVANLSLPTFKLYCLDPANYLASVCTEWLAHLREDEASYVMLITFLSSDDNDIKSSYLVTIISISPVLRDLVWQLLLFGLAIYICVAIEVAMLLYCRESKKETKNLGNK